MDDEMLKIYAKDIITLKMQKKALLKQLIKVEEELTRTYNFINQIK